MRFFTTSLAISTLALSVLASPIPEVVEDRSVSEIDPRFNLFGIPIGVNLNLPGNAGSSGTANPTITNLVTSLPIVGGIITPNVATSVVPTFLQQLLKLNIGQAISALQGSQGTTNMNFLQSLLTQVQNGQVQPASLVGLVSNLQAAIPQLNSLLGTATPTTGSTSVVQQLLSIVTQLLAAIQGAVPSPAASASVSMSAGATTGTSTSPLGSLSTIIASLQNLLSSILGGGSPLSILSFLQSGNTSSTSQLAFLQGVLSGFQSGAISPASFASLVPQLQQAINILSAQNFLTSLPLLGALGGNNLVSQVLNTLKQILAAIKIAVPTA